MVVVVVVIVIVVIIYIYVCVCVYACVGVCELMFDAGAHTSDDVDDDKCKCEREFGTNK